MRGVRIRKSNKTRISFSHSFGTITVSSLMAVDHFDLHIIWDFSFVPPIAGVILTRRVFLFSQRFGCLDCLRPSISAQLTTQPTFTWFGLSLWRYNGNCLLTEFGPYFDRTNTFFQPFSSDGMDSAQSETHVVCISSNNSRKVDKSYISLQYKLQNAPQSAAFAWIRSSTPCKGKQYTVFPGLSLA